MAQRKIRGLKEEKAHQGEENWEAEHKEVSRWIQVNKLQIRQPNLEIVIKILYIISLLSDLKFVKKFTRMKISGYKIYTENA